MKRRMGALLGVMLLVLSGCGAQGTGQAEAGNTETTSVVENQQSSEAGETSNGTEAQGNKTLIAYFTRLPNTVDGDDLDAVVQGGGPYGAIGNSFDTADVDAIVSASITVNGSTVLGNVETIANFIAQSTGGDLFSIETVEKYPTNYDAVINQGGVEQRRSDRPALSTHIENLDEYSVIYLGYPNWYNDMPMALYSFLEEYDFQGKTIVPFCTSAGSGLAGTISDIQQLEPGATVIENALAVHMRNVRNSQSQVEQWIASLNLNR